MHKRKEEPKRKTNVGENLLGSGMMSRQRNKDVQSHGPKMETSFRDAYMHASEDGWD